MEIKNLAQLKTGYTREKRIYYQSTPTGKIFRTEENT